MTQIRLKHLRSVPGLNASGGYCLSGARIWCARNNLDWHAFTREGFTEEQLLATGDPLAARLVEHARQVEAAADAKD